MEAKLTGLGGLCVHACAYTHLGRENGRIKIADLVPDEWCCHILCCDTGKTGGESGFWEWGCRESASVFCMLSLRCLRYLGKDVM